MSMKLSIENLKRGLKWWQEGKWPPDYLNNEYYEIYQDREGGVSKQWLNVTIDRLARWRALRSRRPPNKKEQIFDLLSGKLPQLRRQYERVCSLSNNEPSINTLSWPDIDSFFTLTNIKNGSPVFASKLCHFMFPKVFIVMDRLGTEVCPYDYYWQGMVNEWRLFADKHAAIDMLKNEIKKRTSRDLHSHYPFETKVMELCHVGDKRK
ncbi:MAG: hypothetical protein ACXW18_02565 [Pyrinomonadaceae bacterium]